MKQKYKDREVIAPGTVIISAAGHCNDIMKIVEPNVKTSDGALYYINMSFNDYELGGSSFAQTLNKIGQKSPDIKDAVKFVEAFNALQSLIKDRKIVAGHDIGSGGLITTLLEMCFADPKAGLTVDLSSLLVKDSIRLLFAENVGIVFQASKDSEEDIEQHFKNLEITCTKIGRVSPNGTLSIKNQDDNWTLNISEYRDIWLQNILLSGYQTIRTSKSCRTIFQLQISTINICISISIFR
jgi:phosphoribosylformylglycinamidine synthase